MKYKDVIERIRFATNSTHDLSGKAAQPYFSNHNINIQLKFALDKYASYTHAIEGFYSTQAKTTGEVIQMPDDLIRSQGIRYIFIYNKGLRYPLLEKDPNNVFSNFPVQNITGIPGWYLHWANEVTLYPINNLDPSVTALLNDISATDTQIELATDVSLAAKQGRVTIENEKICYGWKTGTTLYNCQRGVEGTTASSHLRTTTVTENNTIILYRKLHWSFDVPKNSDRVDAVWADKEMEIPDEHIEVICDNVSYKLLAKVSPDRADFYKMDFDKWLEEAKYQIQKGRSEITKTDEVRNGFWSERDTSAYRYY